MGMYVDRRPVGAGGSRDLDQGDVLRDVLIPKLPREQSFGFQRQGANRSDVRWFWKRDLAGEELLAEEGRELRVMSKLDREPFMIVLSNSCDNASGDEPLLIAPVRPFVHYQSPVGAVRLALTRTIEALAPRCSSNGCGRIALRAASSGKPYCEACAPDEDGLTDVPNADVLRTSIKEMSTQEQLQRERDADQWMEISRTATAANPKKFYMPGDPDRGFARSEVHLALSQAVDPGYLSRCFSQLKATRAFGLSEEAIRHLQYTVSSFFGRNPREDNAWPSDEDFALKAIWLEEEIRVAHDPRAKAEMENELATIRERLKR